MKRYLSLALFAVILATQSIVAKPVDIASIVAPKMQIKMFPITKSFLYAMSETISGNKKFLVAATYLKPNPKNMKKAKVFLKQKNISFSVLSKDIEGRVRNYIYIDAKSKKEAFLASSKMVNMGMSVKMGKNLIPSYMISKDMGSFFGKLKKGQIFDDMVQDAYLIQQIQNFSLECLKSKHSLESVVETYMNDLYNRSSIDITGDPKMFENEENGKMEYSPFFVSEFGTRICNCEYSEAVPSARYKDTSFYKAFQTNHKRLFGNEYSLLEAAKEVSIKPLKLVTNKELLAYFNSSFLSDAYSQKELKFSTNSKKVTIFCVNGHDGFKMCKTKKEILEQISFQNKKLY